MFYCNINLGMCLEIQCLDFKTTYISSNSSYINKNYKSNNNYINQFIKKIDIL